MYTDIILANVLGNYYALILLLERHYGTRKGYALSKKQIGKF